MLWMCKNYVQNYMKIYNVNWSWIMFTWKYLITFVFFQFHILLLSQFLSFVLLSIYSHSPFPCPNNLVVGKWVIFRSIASKWGKNMPGIIYLVFSSFDQLNFKKYDEFCFVLEGQIVKYAINYFGKTCIKRFIFCLFTQILQFW